MVETIQQKAISQTSGCINRCGYCCEWLLFRYGNTADKEFLGARGFMIRESTDGTQLEALLFSPCPHLRKYGDKAKCEIYDKRPDACKQAPCPKEEK